MTNLQAALGLAQLEQLEDFISIKKETTKGTKSCSPESTGCVFCRSATVFAATFGSTRCTSTVRADRDELIQYLAKTKSSRARWGLIHEQKPYLGSRSYEITTAYEYWRHVVNIPCSTNLSLEDVERVAECIKNAE